jgi:hypothetical protein
VPLPKQESHAPEQESVEVLVWVFEPQVLLGDCLPHGIQLLFLRGLERALEAAGAVVHARGKERLAIPHCCRG